MLIISTVDIISPLAIVVKIMTIICNDNTTSPLLQVVAPLMGWVRNHSLLLVLLLVKSIFILFLLLPLLTSHPFLLLLSRV